MDVATFVSVDGGTPTVPTSVGRVFFAEGRFVTDDPAAAEAVRAYIARYPGWIREIVQAPGEARVAVPSCGAMTRAGHPCRRVPIDGFAHCGLHAETEQRGYGRLPDGDAGLGLETAINPGDHVPTDAGDPGQTTKWSEDVAADVEAALSEDLDPLSKIFNGTA